MSCCEHVYRTRSTLSFSVHAGHLWRPGRPEVNIQDQRFFRAIEQKFTVILLYRCCSIVEHKRQMANYFCKYFRFFSWLSPIGSPRLRPSSSLLTGVCRYRQSLHTTNLVGSVLVPQIFLTAFHGPDSANGPLHLCSWVRFGSVPRGVSSCFNHTFSLVSNVVMQRRFVESFPHSGWCFLHRSSSL